jgi:hypothetical protein
MPLYVLFTTLTHEQNKLPTGNTRTIRSTSTSRSRSSASCCCPGHCFLCFSHLSVPLTPHTTPPPHSSPRCVPAETGTLPRWLRTCGDRNSSRVSSATTAASAPAKGDPFQSMNRFQFEEESALEARHRPQAATQSPARASRHLHELFSGVDVFRTVTLAVVGSGSMGLQCT